MQKPCWKNSSAKQHYWWICVTIAYGLMSATLAAQSLSVLEQHLVDTTLPNGLRVVILPKPSASTVAIVIAYHVGSKDESIEQTGFTHLFEHLMFQGSKNLPAGKFDYYCSLAGGDNNAFTTYDQTVYFMVLPSAQLELGLWLESDRMQFLEVTEEKLQTQINVVLQEIKENVENRPFGTFSQTSARLAYRAGCPYSWDPYGLPEHLRSATLADVLQFYQTFYGPNNACLVIVGNVAPRNTIQLVERYFGPIPQRAQPEHPVFTPECRQHNQYAQVYDQIPTEAIFLQFHAPGFTDSNLYAAELLAAILSEGLSSRLVKRLRYEQQLVSEIAAYVDDREHTSLFTISAVARDPSTNAQQLYDAVWTELDQLLRDGITDRELMKAKNQLRTGVFGQFERTLSLALLLAHHTLFFDDPHRSFTLPDRIEAVTKEAVMQLARQIFDRSKQIRIDFLPKWKESATSE